ncbi:MAG: hypothetical protein FWD23_10760 [Oscillospiraceae bacterium]|nr:hypothetical protein [Oscillospiraceae bacterium]
MMLDIIRDGLSFDFGGYHTESIGDLRLLYRFLMSDRNSNPSRKLPRKLYPNPKLPLPLLPLLRGQATII